MGKYKYLIVGSSGSGKSTLVEEYCKRHHKVNLLSYTTRPIRENEVSQPTHIHVSKKEAKRIMETRDIVAYTNYNGYDYFATKQQFNTCDFYIIDIDGIFSIKKHDNLPEYKIIGIKSDNKVENMLKRGDSMDIIQNRLKIDNNYFSNLEGLCDIIIKNNGTIDNTVYKLEQAIIYAEQLEDEENKYV